MRCQAPPPSSRVAPAAAAAAASVFPRDQGLQHLRQGAGDQIARFAEQVELSGTLDAAHVSDQVVRRHPLDLRRAGLQLLPVLHGQAVGIDHGHGARDSPFLQRVGNARDGVVEALETVRGDRLEARFGLVRDKLRSLSGTQDDRAVGATVPKHGIGFLSRVGGEEVRQVEDIARPFVHARSLAPDHRRLETLGLHVFVDALPPRLVLVERERPEPALFAEHRPALLGRRPEVNPVSIPSLDVAHECARSLRLQGYGEP